MPDTLEPYQFIWCRFCEEASPEVGEHSTRGAFCPMCGDGNSLPGDYVYWDQFQQLHPEYPKIPESDVRYPLTSETIRQALEEAQD